MSEKCVVFSILNLFPTKHLYHGLVPPCGCLQHAEKLVPVSYGFECFFGRCRFQGADIDIIGAPDNCWTLPQINVCFSDLSIQAFCHTQITILCLG